MTFSLFGLGCSGADAPKGPHGALPEPRVDPDREEPGEQGRAIVAGGCFWCVEGVFEELAGVERVVSGYAGGSASDADYRSVSGGHTQHAEAVEIVYDPERITYGQLLRVFFATHDPTQLNRQGPDRGRQYRSAIFPVDDEQRRAAEDYIALLNERGVYEDPVVTTVEDFDAFYPAEEYHQDFVARNPQHPYVQAHAVAKIKKTRSRFPELIDTDQD